MLASVLVDGWGVAAGSMDYRPIGFGSHHWEVTGVGGGRWFLTVDELDVKRHSRHEPREAALGRLRAAFAAAGALRDRGRAFVVAPIATRDGKPLARAGDRYAAALYPFVEGESFSWGEFSSPAHRLAVLDLVVAVHTAPLEVARLALADDFTVPHRDELEAALDPGGEAEDCGPYARPTSALLRDHAAAVRRLLVRYGELVETARAERGRAVLTHGEPHPGNTMLTADGWRLIDWDTALLAPPERDLWSLDPGDRSIVDAYAAGTGVTPMPAMLELYRIRWDIADIAVDVSRFRRRHTGSADDDETWRILRRLVTSVGRQDAAGGNLSS